MGITDPDPAMATTVAMRPPTTAATPQHIMDMDMADRTTDIGGLIMVDIARPTIVRTTVRVSTAAGRNQLPKPRCAAAGSDIRLLLVAEPHSQQRKVDTQEAGSVRPSRLSIRVFFPLSETSLDPLGTVGRNSYEKRVADGFWGGGAVTCAATAPLIANRASQRQQEISVVTPHTTKHRPRL